MIFRKYDFKGASMPLYVRVQEKGQVTIPTRLRRKLNIKKGDTVMMIEAENGVLIMPAEVVLTEALDEMGKALKADGVALDEWIEHSRQIREKLLEEKYGIKEKP
jgi:AbrB family looped-hinge helix DNA binding protein